MSIRLVSLSGKWSEISKQLSSMKPQGKCPSPKPETQEAKNG